MSKRNQDQPLVSIIVRTKDRKDLFFNALRSISRQTYPYIEVVIVNDGGEEIDEDLIRDALGSIPYRYRHLIPGVGRAGAANEGVKSATGEFVTFLDDDDEYLENHVEALVGKSIESNARIVYSDALKVERERVGEKWIDREAGVFSSFDFSYDDLLVENYIPIITCLFERRLILDAGGFDESFDLYEDWDLLIRLTAEHEPKHVPRVTAKYIFWDKDEQIALNKEFRSLYYKRIFEKHKWRYTAETILNIKEKREAVEAELVKHIQELLDLQSQYTAFKEKKNLEIVTVKEEISRLKEGNALLEKRAAELQAEIFRMMNTIGWRLLTKLRKSRDLIIPQGSFRRRLYERMIRRLKEGSGIVAGQAYHEWLRENEPSSQDLEKQRKMARTFTYRPVFSIIVPVYNPDTEMLIEMIESVKAQTYDNWELCLADGGDEKSTSREVLQEYASSDKRIKYAGLNKNHGIAVNTNKAVEMAGGEYLVFLDHDDKLAPNALFEVASLLNKRQDIDLIYSDEDKLDEKGNRCEPFFKPDWSPDLLRSVNYICHLLVVRRGLYDTVGGLREEYRGAQDYDFVLRCSLKTDRIAHIPKILYHWRKHRLSTASNVSVKSYAHENGKKALESFLASLGIDAVVVDGPGETNYRVKYRIRGAPRVSIIIPFRNKVKLLRKCVESILEKTEYDNYELLLVSNRSDEMEVFDYLEHIGSRPFVKILEYNDDFNYSKINNYAVARASGDVLLFLNNDTEVVTGQWLYDLLEHTMREEIGAVGAKLLYPDGRIQHAGVVLGMTGFAGHVFSGLLDGVYTYFGSVDFPRNYLAVTGACMMIRREVFDEIGGFDERFKVCGSDVEICLRLIGKGYRVVYTPYARLIHHEALTRGGDIPIEDFRLSKKVYRDYILSGDPFYNPNLTLLKTDCSLKAKNEDNVIERIINEAVKN